MGEIEEDLDMLRRFKSSQEESKGGGDLFRESAGEVELSLGLSLNGVFGRSNEEMKDTRRLVRSSSISTLSIFPTTTELFQSVSHPSPLPPLPLARTCSLPVETEEERRKRKEMQCLKRMEAKRKRTEKRNNNFNNNSKGGGEKEEVESLEEEAGRLAPAAADLPRWSMSSAGRPISHGSIGSQGSCASGVSDLDSRPMPIQGLSNCTEVKSPSAIPPSSNHTNHKTSTVHPTPTMGKTPNSSIDEDEALKKKRSNTGRMNGTKEMERNMMEEMPCVSTRGDGPNGRRIEGFLYKYRKGEEVRIVCVCHGSFLTPAEFVKHAGGGDVAHPLRHIVVSPTPSAFC